MQCSNPIPTDTIPEYNLVCEKMNYHRWHDYEIVLPTDGWRFLPFDSKSGNDANAVLIGFSSRYWTESFHITRIDYGKQGILHQETATAYDDFGASPEMAIIDRTLNLLVPEGETLFKKGSFRIESRLFDFLLTGGTFDDTDKRRFLCMCYPEGEWPGPAFLAEHIVQMHPGLKADLMGNHDFTYQAMVILLTLKKTETCNN